MLLGSQRVCALGQSEIRNVRQLLIQWVSVCLPWHLQPDASEGLFKSIWLLAQMLLLELALSLDLIHPFQGHSKGPLDHFLSTNCMKTGSCYIFENLEFCWSFLEFMYSLICSTDISRAPTLCQMGQATVGCKGVPLRRLWCRGATKASTAKTVGPREYEKGWLPRWKQHSENSSW